MRVAITDTVGIWELQAPEKFARASFRLRTGHNPLLEGRLDELLHQGVSRVEGCRGTLCHIGDTGAAQFSQRPA